MKKGKTYCKLNKVKAVRTKNKRIVPTTFVDANKTNQDTCKTKDKLRKCTNLNETCVMDLRVTLTKSFYENAQRLC